MEQVPIDDDPPAHAGAEDHREHAFCRAPRAIDRLGQGKATRIVLDADLAAEQPLEILFERPPVEADRICIAHEARHRGHRAWGAHTHAHPRFTKIAFHAIDQAAEDAQRRVVIAGRGWHTLAPHDAPVAIERCDFYLGAAEVDPDAQTHSQIGQIQWTADGAPNCAAMRSRMGRLA